MPKIIAQGAEAKLLKDDGKIIKKRIEKGYRVKELDEKLRGERTELEKRLIEKARTAGVPVPEIIDKREFNLEIEFIEGEKVKNVLNDDLSLCDQIGENIARLHNRNIIHGDLTTSNMIERDSDIYFIDFGLGYFSQRVEDKAMDLFLLNHVLKSTHYEVWEKAFDKIKQSYIENYEKGEAVIERLQEVKKRGRYK